MDRRTAIQHVIILGAGASLLTYCGDKPSQALKNISLTGSQENLLSVLTETIIPTTDFVGAKELGSHKFILVMADDCTSPEDQTKFMSSMNLFDETCKKKYTSKFIKCTPQQRLDYLLAIEAKTDIPEEVIHFYQSVKQLTIQSFTSSEEFLTKVRNFNFIPGMYKGCVPVGNA